MRTVRIVAVATAIGATAGAAVVLTLAGKPPSDSIADSGKTLVVVRSLVQPAEAAVALPPAVAAAPVAAAPAAAASAPVIASAPPPAPLAVAPAQPQPTVQASIDPPAQPVSAPAAQPAPVAAPAPVNVLPPRPSDSAAITTPTAPASVAALAEIPATGALAALPGQPRDRTVVSAPDKSGVQKSALAKPRPDDPAARAPTTVASAKPAPRPASTGGIGGLFRHLFSARAGTSYYPN